MRLVVVGATGAVGSVIMTILDERDLRISELVPVATARSAGSTLCHRGAPVTVRLLDAEVFDGADIALFDVPDEVALEWAPIAVERGATVVDNSAAWRMSADVPLVVPEVNPEAALSAPRRIIASPNCTMLTVVVPLAPLHSAAGVQRVIVSSYQAASGAGKPGVDELWTQIRDVAGAPEGTITSGRARDVLPPGTAFAHPLALNVIPRIGSTQEGGYTSEEVKLGEETRKVLGLPDLLLSATCVRVPTIVGHGVSVHAEFERPISVEEARAILAAAPGVELRDDAGAHIYPTPLEAAGRDAVFVGRIRQDPRDPRALEWF
ncbi:MAG: aspartate-semialdehyde dehydrogenase, partial [Chloroflexota bacterium]|nr:aspartate-semialdehyde dehydrogenase [Chloroflexota bacterium]